MITFRATLADDALLREVLADMYADLIQLPAQIDTVLGLPKPSTPPSAASTTTEWYLNLSRPRAAAAPSRVESQESTLLPPDAQDLDVLLYTNSP